MHPISVAIEILWLLINYDKKTQEIIKWSANAFMFVSAIALSVSITASMLPITYFGFLLAHLMWVVIALGMKDNALCWQYAFFIPLDVYAMYIRF